MSFLIYGTCKWYGLSYLTLCHTILISMMKCFLSQKAHGRVGFAKMDKSHWIHWKALMKGYYIPLTVVPIVLFEVTRRASMKQLLSELEWWLKVKTMYLLLMQNTWVQVLAPTWQVTTFCNSRLGGAMIPLFDSTDMSTNIFTNPCTGIHICLCLLFLNTIKQ